MVTDQVTNDASVVKMLCSCCPDAEALVQFDDPNTAMFWPFNTVSFSWLNPA